jgi:hypothetical protein
MKSYSTLRTLYGTLSNNAETSNLALGVELMNDEIKRVCSKRDWPFLQTSRTMSTVAAQQAYYLPGDCDMITNVSVIIGTTKYVPKEAPNRQFWDTVTQATTFQSDFPQYFYVYEGKINLFPMPSSSLTNAMTINYRKKVVDLSVADYATGTVSITTATTTITGSGATFTNAMEGRYIKFTGGDGQWYKILTYTDATHIVLETAYLGDTLAGVAFTIGEMSPLPDAYQDIPLWSALATFYSTINVDVKRADRFTTRYNELVAQLEHEYGTKTTDPSLHDNQPTPILNPNLFISL